MSKFDLRDISERLTGSSDTEAVVFEFMAYLQSLHADWRAALAFYEVSQDCLVNVYELNEGRLQRRDVTLQVEHLPGRLVRKFFHPSAFFNQNGPKPLLSQWLKSSPSYEPDPAEAPQLRLLSPIQNWQSAACLALADHDDVLALLFLASDKQRAFSPRAIEEILPVKSVAALALAQHLHRAAWNPDAEANARTMRQAASEFQERIQLLTRQARELEADNLAKAEKLASLAGEIEKLDRNSSEYKTELDRVKGTVLALEEQTALATEHLSEAYTQLNLAQARLSSLEATLGFAREAFQALAQPHDPAGYADSMVGALCDRFGIERCSLMLLDGSGETMQIAAQSGIPEEIAARVKVRVGQGIAGWVAHNRKPLLVRVKEELPAVQREVKETYNSDSFICVPLAHAGRVMGVLNLSNKEDGEPFEDLDLDRATLAAATLALALAASYAAAASNGVARAA